MKRNSEDNMKRNSDLWNTWSSCVMQMLKRQTRVKGAVRWARVTDATYQVLLKNGSPVSEQTYYIWALLWGAILLFIPYLWISIIHLWISIIHLWIMDILD